MTLSPLWKVTHAPFWPPQPPQEGTTWCEKQYCRLVFLHVPLRPVARLPCIWEGRWLSIVDDGIPFSQSTSIYTLHPSLSIWGERQWRKPWGSEVLSEYVLFTWAWPYRGLQGSRPTGNWRSWYPHGPGSRGMAKLPSQVQIAKCLALSPYVQWLATSSSSSSKFTVWDCWPIETTYWV